MRRFFMLGVPLAIILLAIGGLNGNAQRDHRLFLDRMDVPPEAVVVRLKRETTGFGFGYDYAVEYRLPGVADPEAKLRELARARNLEGNRKSRFRYALQNGDVRESLTFEPTSATYRVESAF